MPTIPSVQEPAGTAVTSEVLTTSSPDEAVDYVERVYGSRLAVGRTVDPFRMEHRYTDFGAWSSDAMTLTTGGFRCEPCGVVTVVRVRSGRMRLSTARETLSMGTGDVFVMADSAHAFTTVWADADATFLRLPVDTLERVAHESAPRGGDRLALLGRRPVTTRAGRRLTGVADFAQRQLTGGDPPPTAAVQAAIGDLLAATVLATFPNTLVAELAEPAVRRDVPSAVASALDFVARNADLPLTSADIAASASVSRRALEMAFRDHLATSPAAYLRRYRLGRVHEELAAAEPGDGTSVTEVAARWRFTQSSRFAAYYRSVYGEQPSRTLRNLP